MHVERTVRVVHGLSSSSFISLKIYLHFMIKHFNLTHVSHCHRKVDNVWLYQARSRPVFVAPRENKLILSWSAGRTQHPLQSTVARQRHAKTIQTKSVLLEKTRSEWKDHSPTPVIQGAPTFPSLPHKTWRNVYLRTKCWLGVKKGSLPRSVGSTQ